MIKYVVVIFFAVVALIINFKPKLIAEKILKKEAENDIVIKIKFIAALICIIDFILVMVWL